MADLLPKRPLVGPQVWSGSPSAAELLASLPFDYVFIDMEHTPYASFETVAHLIRAINSRGKDAWVRAPENHPPTISKLIELGAAAVVVPQINDREGAARAAAAARYAPRGTRGYCPAVRRFQYGLASIDQVDNQSPPLVIALIEDVAALPHLDAIASTDIDGLYPGLGDLSFTISDPGAREDYFHPAVVSACDAIVAAALARGKLTMASLATLARPDAPVAATIDKWFARGIHAFNLTQDVGMIREWSSRFLREMGRLP